jgi:hypothetical protein
LIQREVDGSEGTLTVGTPPPERCAESSPLRSGAATPIELAAGYPGELSRTFPPVLRANDVFQALSVVLFTLGLVD